MTIRLLEGIQLAGVHQAIGSVLTLTPDLEAHHVSLNRAVYTTLPDIGDSGVPVMGKTNPLTGGIGSLNASGRDVLSDLGISAGQFGIEACTIVPYRVLCQLADGKYLCTDLNAAYGSFGVRLWTFDGDVKTGIGTKANLIYTNVSLGDVYDASGTVIIGGGGAGIQQAWQLSNGDILFAAAGKSVGGFDTKHFMFRAKQSTGYTIGTDTNATNKRASLNMGTLTGVTDPTTQTASIRMLHSRSLCEVKTTVGGVLTRTIILAEYNVASGRVTGAANDQVIAWRSTDNGVTWSKFLEFNTNGTHRFDHFHSVIQDPYTRQVYFLTGDNGDECAIIKWDGTSTAPAANASLSVIAATPGWGVIYGDELKRYGDLVFTPDGISALPDCDTESAEGGTTGFASVTIDRSLAWVASHAPISRSQDVPPLIGMRHSSGCLIYGALRTQSANTTANPYMDFWTSGDGKNWNNAARVKNYLASTGNVKELFEDSFGNVIAGAAYGGGVQFTSDTQSGTSAILSISRGSAGNQLVVG